jgi:hypothetical protein
MQQLSNQATQQQLHADRLFAPLGIGRVVPNVMSQSVLACGLHGRDPETMSQAEKVSSSDGRMGSGSAMVG